MDSRLSDEAWPDERFSEERLRKREAWIDTIAPERPRRNLLVETKRVVELSEGGSVLR